MFKLFHGHTSGKVVMNCQTNRSTSGGQTKMSIFGFSSSTLECGASVYRASVVSLYLIQRHNYNWFRQVMWKFYLILINSPASTIKTFMLENEIYENPENQQKVCWYLNKLIEKNCCNQNLCLVEPLFMVYFIFSENPV